MVLTHLMKNRPCKNYDFFFVVKFRSEVTEINCIKSRAARKLKERETS